MLTLFASRLVLTADTTDVPAGHYSFIFAPETAQDFALAA